MADANGWDRDDTFIKGKKGEDPAGDPIGEKIASTTDGDKERLCVDSNVTGINLSGVPRWFATLRYDDMNPANGGVSRGTNIGAGWTTIYNYTGSGVLIGFSVTVESLNDQTWYCRLVIDGNEIFGPAGISLYDLYKEEFYNFDSSSGLRKNRIGLEVIDTDSFTFEGPLFLALAYDSSVQILLRKASGGKKFRAGIVSIVKE